MTGWTTDELARIGGAEEIRISSRRADGTIRPFATAWVARFGDEICVRSAYGPDNGWFRRARASGEGRIRAAGIGQRWAPGTARYASGDRCDEARVSR